MSTPSMLELAERCEKATSVDQARLLEEAWLAIYGYLPDAGDLAQSDAAQDFAFKLEARAYLDAAMTLVPEGWSWRMGFGGEAYWAAVYPGVIPNWRSDPIAATPALALCAAALRANTNKEQEQ